ncbi:hypothetical protein [Nostoc sp. WHI]|uniref:hypothetical protein n=1 Tax=Nostoc sp. WHI TaxID=2650611 RepID=UPI0018C4AB31|nr:hypothetical protein [Nostoc sp. WHI]MBG1269705.1 hypothetical protein [Nostoc sp. WHI]
MNNLAKLLQDIKDNPTLYLDKPSITCLHSFLIGYLGTLSKLGFTQKGWAMEGFQEWIQERAKTKVSQSWAGIILFGGSERSAFYSFFNLFDEFLKREKISKNESNEIGENLKFNVDDLKPRIYDYNLYEIIGRIKKSPGMFLGTASITKFDMYLRGYILAKREVALPPTSQEREFEGFQSWIEEKYGIKSGQSWSKIILFYSVDEHEALQKFFELFEEYLNRNKSLEVDENCG